MTPVEIVLAFMECIRKRDPDKVAEMMTEDHLFIDSLGRQTRGREAMRAGWRSYYALCQDYWVGKDEIFQDGNKVAVFGEAGGKIAGIRWSTPAAWLSVVEKGLVKEWRVYADNKPVYDILAKG